MKHLRASLPTICRKLSQFLSLLRAVAARALTASHVYGLLSTSRHLRRRRVPPPPPNWAEIAVPLSIYLDSPTLLPILSTPFRSIHSPNN